MQFHFVGLNQHEPLELPTYNQSGPGVTNEIIKNESVPGVNSKCTNETPVDKASDEHCDGFELVDETIQAGDECTLEITGSTYASLMSLENPEQIVSIAPAEGQKPLNIMTDPDFELMC